MASAVRLSRGKLSSPPFDKEFPFASSFRKASSSSAPPHPSSSITLKSQKKSNDRLSAAVDAIHERNIPREILGKLSSVRSETDLMNVVEQRIWHSMEEGNFDNLPGKGKPLNLGVNPHADPPEDTIYRILSKNGCSPEWVELNKDIRSNISIWRLTLKKAWENRRTGDFSKWEDY